jgi:hypothetical protein
VNQLQESYSGAWAVIRRYWHAYGGWKSLLLSPYFHVSVLLTIISFPRWYRGGGWDEAIAILPNLLGFSLAGFAVFLAMGSEQFRTLISGTDENAENGPSPLMLVVSAFCHFSFVQLCALLYAIVTRALAQLPSVSSGWLATGNKALCIISWFVGYWAFIYAICSGAAALFATFRVATWFDSFVASERQKGVEK